MIPFGTTHGSAFDRHVSHRGDQVVIVTEIVTVNYNDGSRPSTAIMEDAYFQVVEQDGRKVLTQRVVSDLPVTVVQALVPAEFDVRFAAGKTEVVVTIGSDVVVQESKVEPYKPVASDARTA